MVIREAGDELAAHWLQHVLPLPLLLRGQAPGLAQRLEAREEVAVHAEETVHPGHGRPWRHARHVWTRDAAFTRIPCCVFGWTQVCARTTSLCWDHNAKKDSHVFLFVDKASQEAAENDGGKRLAVPTLAPVVACANCPTINRSKLSPLPSSFVPTNFAETANVIK